MSTTATAVQARIATQKLIELTNPNDDSASSVNTTLLEYAVTDMATDFESQATQEYDDTDAAHLALGVQGAVAYLVWYQGHTLEDAKLDSWRESVRQYARRSNRRRVSPVTTVTVGQTQPSPQQRPGFDPQRFRPTELAPPSAGSDED